MLMVCSRGDVIHNFSKALPPELLLFQIYPNGSLEEEVHQTTLYKKKQSLIIEPKKCPTY